MRQNRQIPAAKLQYNHKKVQMRNVNSNIKQLIRIKMKMRILILVMIIIQLIKTVESVYDQTIQSHTTSIETIELSLSVQNNGQLTTFIEIGQIQQNMKIDINEQFIEVCCKRQNSIFQKIYYFLFNPFFQIYDYSCKQTDQHGIVKNQSAKIAKLGYLEIDFHQEQFPLCSKGTLGLSNNSYFLSLLPVNLKSFSIYKNQAQYKKYTLKFGQDQSAIKEFSYFDVQSSSQWQVSLQNIKYNLVSIKNYPLIFSTSIKSLLLPSEFFQFVQKQLIKDYSCRQIEKQLYCPCESGSSSGYPSFYFSISNGFKFQIFPESYMVQDSQTCKVLIKSTQQQKIRANILFFENKILKFDPINRKIGVIQTKSDPNNNQKIKLPLQLILNCLVILLLCIFLALVLIQIIKRVSGLAQARQQVFRVDTRDKYQRNYND